MILDDATNICMSGGAEGADLQWGMCAGAAGHLVYHWGFSGHRSRAPISEIVTLNEDQLAEADVPCKRASARVKRYFPPKSPFVRNLLRRNWFQVAHSGSCYAVSKIENGLVAGGTAWATAMFIDRFGGAACPCYVFDQQDDWWYEWSGDGVGWTAMLTPPKPTGIWAGVGSRTLLENGKQAIRTLMEWQPPMGKAA